MAKIKEYTRKQPEASNDYTLAHNICNTLNIGCSIIVEPLNDKVFRKYLYECSAREQKQFATRKVNDFSRTVINITTEF